MVASYIQLQLANKEQHRNHNFCNSVTWTHTIHFWGHFWNNWLSQQLIVCLQTQRSWLPNLSAAAGGELSGNVELTCFCCKFCVWITETLFMSFCLWEMKCNTNTVRPRVLHDGIQWNKSKAEGRKPLLKCLSVLIKMNNRKKILHGVISRKEMFVTE